MVFCNPLIYHVPITITIYVTTHAERGKEKARTSNTIATSRGNGSSTLKDTVWMAAPPPPPLTAAGALGSVAITARESYTLRRQHILRRQHKRYTLTKREQTKRHRNTLKHVGHIVHATETTKRLRRGRQLKHTPRLCKPQ